MSKEYLNPAELFPSEQYGFSQIVTADRGRLVFISGQVAWNEKEEFIGDDLGTQTREALRNVERAVQAAGGTLNDVVSLRIYIRHDQIAQDRLVSEALKAFFAEDHLPTATFIGVQSLANKGFLVEIEPIAVIESLHSLE
jgi:enamine deaminase RidA (YjgF/YER057c/UK114 family)